MVRACGEKGGDIDLGKDSACCGTGVAATGRPKKTWRRNMQEGLESLNLLEEQAQNRDQWKRVINRLTS